MATQLETGETQVPAREPKGYLPTYGLASYGLYLAILTPVMGGLALKMQDLNPGNMSAATAQLSLVTGVGALFALVAQPIVGRLSDRTTSRMGMRKPWIVAGVIGAAISLILVGIAPNLTVVMIGWCLAQVFSNFAQAAETATIPDQVPVARRGVVSGIIGACTPLAVLTGSIGLAALSTDTMRFLIPALIALVLGIVFAVRLKDKVLAAKPAERLNVGEFFRSFVFNPKTYPNLGWAWLTKFLIMFGYASVGTFLVMFMGTEYGMDTNQQAQFNLMANVVSVLFMVVFSVFGGRWSDRIGKRRAFVAIGGMILAVGLVIMAISPVFGQSAGPIVVLFAEAFIGTGAGLFFGIDMALCTQVLPNPEDTAKDLGVLNIANALPQSLAPMLAGPIVLWAAGWMGGSGYPVWFFLAALVAFVGGALVYRIKGVQ